MISTLLCEFIFLVFLYLGLTDPNNGELDYNWKDITGWTLIFHFFFEDLVELAVRRWDFFTYFWSCYTLATNSLLLLGAAITYFGYDEYVVPKMSGQGESSGVTNVTRQWPNDCRSELSGNHPVNIASKNLTPCRMH